ncbi:hypothetical protein JAAARDRAFT_74158 [Jaapia argillacea MUCL 33604]|uniref:TECPR1-like DysF domain-containing protein n=1 Tax=Jaapia argillacea MUCL 33604 TaxID=933084 RepID=A0A067PJ79_9AGAM|nr:hypothetical protein JAAARDRAFT_74158 [Jaapia argillacea MUCL 33604]
MITDIDYVEIPTYATLLQSSSTPHDIRLAPTITTPLPHPTPSSSASSPTAPTSPAKALAFNLPQMLLSSIPTPPPGPRGAKTIGLLSNKDPLSIPITSANFRRFVSKSGPVFWVQDRIEEVVMWRRGGRVTGVWMAGYAFLCYFPRMILLVPHAALIGVLLATHPSRRKSHGRTPSTGTETSGVPPPPPASAGEGSVDWLANLQAIQNLMGFVADASDFVNPVVPHLTYNSPYTFHLLTFAIVSFMALLPIVCILPLRFTFLVLGLTPFLLTHPFTQTHLIPFILHTPLNHPLSKLKQRMRTRLLRVVDDDKLEDRHWVSEMKEVELFENERWSAIGDGAGGSWSKGNLRVGERVGWTRGRDGWSGVNEDGSGDVRFVCPFYHGLSALLLIEIADLGA